MEMYLTRGAKIIYQVIRLCQYKYQYTVAAGSMFAHVTRSIDHRQHTQ